MFYCRHCRCYYYQLINRHFSSYKNNQKFEHQSSKLNAPSNRTREHREYLVRRMAERDARRSLNEAESAAPERPEKWLLQPTKQLVEEQSCKFKSDWSEELLLGCSEMANGRKCFQIKKRDKQGYLNSFPILMIPTVAYPMVRAIDELLAEAVNPRNFDFPSPPSDDPILVLERRQIVDRFCTFQLELVFCNRNGSLTFQLKTVNNADWLRTKAFRIPFGPLLWLRQTMARILAQQDGSQQLGPPPVDPDKHLESLNNSREASRSDQNLENAKTSPPPHLLFYGTNVSAVHAIFQCGRLSPKMSCPYVYLTAVRKTAECAGKWRTNRPTILEIHAQQAAEEAGIRFYRPLEDGPVWLAEHIPTKYIRICGPE